MNNQLFHITNHWALEKNVKNLKAHLLWWQFWHKPIFAGKKYFWQSGFYHGKNRFFHLLAKTCQPWQQLYTCSFI